ncbi:MAG TPA: PrsW family intramembrane metalloprotease [Xanthomonadales bacterium]|nr:PrsW family intramembrane metalloprotease [Xanthomonadales bacterium]
MPTLVCLLPVFLPVMFWAAYHRHADRHLPEPASHLLLAFCLGIGSFYVGLYGYIALDLVGLRFDAYELAESNLPGLFAYSLLVIGIIEESAKLLPFLVVILHFKEFNEPIDGIIYASFIALGFAAVENIYYLEFLTRTEAYARGFVGPVLHIVFSSIWGYFIGRAFLRKRHRMLTIGASLLFAALLHGVYDFIAIGLPATALPIAAALIIIAWIWRLRLIRDLHACAAELRASAVR